jgi:pimeloyl-ACP methyl ester carboxylesterase
MRDYLDGGIAFDVLDRLAGLAAPTLVVGGSLDVLTPPSLSRELAGRFSAGRLEILEGAGHFPWVDEPNAFRSAVGGFLDGLDEA